MSDYKIGVLSDEEMENMPEEGKKIMGRMAVSAKPSESDVQALAGHIKAMRGRSMFDSDSLQRELIKIQNKK